MTHSTQPASQPNERWRWLALAAACLGLLAVTLGAAGSHAIDLSAAGAAQRWSIALQIHYFQAAALMALAALSAAQSAGQSAGLSAGQSAGQSADLSTRMAAGVSGSGATGAGPFPATKPPASRLLLPAWVQFNGTLLFCGSLYLRALRESLLPGWVTPMGGLVLISGWLLLVGALVIMQRGAGARKVS